MSESELHLQMKQWIADEYLKNNIPISSITFEKLLYHKTISRYKTHTAADVFIKDNGGTAIYCQCSCHSLWVKAFIEKRLPIIRDNCSNVVIVVPYDLEARFPILFQRFHRELRKEGIEIIISPFTHGVTNKSKVPIEMSYRALEKLCKLRNKYSPNKPIVDFIESDLERLVRKSCNRR